MAKITKEWCKVGTSGNDDIVIVIDGIQLGRPSHVRACVEALAGLKPEKVPALMEMLDTVIRATNRYHGKQCCEPREDCPLCSLLDRADAALAEVKAP